MMQPLTHDASRPFRIGVTSMMFWNVNVETAVARAAAAGYEAIEIWAEHLWRGPEDPGKVRRALADNGLACSVHCPIMDLNVTSPNRGIRIESQRQLVQSIELSAELGAELLVVHPGNLYSLKDSLDEFWRLQDEALGVFLEQADRCGVRIAFENSDSHNHLEVVRFAADIRRALQPFAFARHGVTHDTTHLITTQANLDFIAGLDNIIHVHLSDAVAHEDGRIRTHLPLGEGALDVPTILGAMLAHGFRGVVSLETFIPASEDQTRVLQQRAAVLAAWEKVLAGDYAH